MPYTLNANLRRLNMRKQIGLAGTMLLDAHGLQREAQSSTPGSLRESRWATPKTRDYKDASMTRPPIPRKDGKHRMDELPAQIHMQEANWSTPTSRDYKGIYPQWSQESEKEPRRTYLPDQAHCNTYKGRLNPRWVETLMGLPVGWVMPSCANPWTIAQTNCECSEMELCPQQQSEQSESCGQTLEQVLGPDIMRRFNELTESLEVPDGDAEANMFALEEVLNNRDNPNE